MGELKNIEQIYVTSRPEIKQQFREIQTYIQKQSPDKKITVAKTMQIIVEGGFAMLTDHEYVGDLDEE